MSKLSNEEIEGRLNAQREALILLFALFARLDPERLWAGLEEGFQFQNSQEDPGALPTRAFAIESAMMRELKLIADGARAAERSDPTSSRSSTAGTPPS